MIVDKFNEVGNNFAISSKGIGDALMKSASSLSTAGNSIDQSIGILVAANNVIQDPEIVGTGAKTISMRLRNTAGELEKLGEDAEGSAESITKLQTQLLNLTKGKVNIMLDENTFKSTYDILLELSKVWNTLSDKSRADVTRLVAGVRQGNVLAAIMSGMNDGAKATETSLNSAGSALKENELVLESIQGRLTKMKSTFQGLSQTLIGTDMFKGLITGATKALEVITWIVDKIGLLPALIIATTITLNALGKSVGGVKTNRLPLFDTPTNGLAVTLNESKLHNLSTRDHLEKPTKLRMSA